MPPPPPSSRRTTPPRRRRRRRRCPCTSTQCAARRWSAIAPRRATAQKPTARRRSSRRCRQRGGDPEAERGGDDGHARRTKRRRPRRAARRRLAPTGSTFRPGILQRGESTSDPTTREFSVDHSRSHSEAERRVARAADERSLSLLQLNMSAGVRGDFVRQEDLLIYGGDPEFVRRQYGSYQCDETGCDEMKCKCKKYCRCRGVPIAMFEGEDDSNREGRRKPTAARPVSSRTRTSRPSTPSTPSRPEKETSNANSRCNSLADIVGHRRRRAAALLLLIARERLVEPAELLLDLACASGSRLRPRTTRPPSS